MHVLNPLFTPRSIAVIGASNNTEKIRGRIFKLLREGGFDGALYPVNPGHDQIQGVTAYPDVSVLPQTVDLALIAVTADQVMPVLAQCEQQGIQAAIIYTAGMRDVRTDMCLEDQIAEFAQRANMRILGPNCEGFIDTARNLIATFSPTLLRCPPIASDALPLRARVSIVSQSGAMAFALYARAHAEHIPVRHLVSTGNEADVELLEVVDYLITEGGTRAILLFIEGLKHPERFRTVAERAADAGVVLIVAKIGRSIAGQRAAVSHTAHLSGTDTAYDAVFTAHGALRVDTPEEMLAIAAAVSAGLRPAGRKVAMITTSGGIGAWAADICTQAGLEIPPFDPGFEQQLAAIVPSYGATGNPVDVTAQVVEDGGATLVNILHLLQQAPGIDIGLIIVSLVAPERLTRIAQELTDIYAASQRPLVFHSAGGVAPAALQTLACVGGVHLGLEAFAKTMVALERHQQFLQRRLAMRPRAAPVTAPVFFSIPADVRGSLDVQTVQCLLRAWNIPMAPDVIVTTPEQAAGAAQDMGWPVALKVASPDIAHKTDVGGVVLDLCSMQDVQAAGERILTQVRLHAPQAIIQGLQVQKMMPAGHELVIGVTRDTDFGPLVMLGLGGIHVEVLRDVVFAPAPLTDAQAQDMIDRLKASVILHGVRGRPAADIPALVRLLVQISLLASTHADRIREMDMNPVLLYPAGQGAIVVDALVVVDPVDSGLPKS